MLWFKSLKPLQTCICFKNDTSCWGACATSHCWAFTPAVPPPQACPGPLSCQGTAGCRNARRELGPSQPSQMTAHTKKDLTLCHNCPLSLWSARKNSTRLLKATPPSPPSTMTHPLFVSTHPLPCPYFSPDPGRVHKRPIRSIAGHIYKWKRPNNGAVREKNEQTEGHSQMWRWVGRGKEGAASHCCPPHLQIEGRKKEGLGRGEEEK